MNAGAASPSSTAPEGAPGSAGAGGAAIPLRTGVEYRCGDCAAIQILKGGDPVRCRTCGFRILYKIRTKRCKLCLFSFIFEFLFILEISLFLLHYRTDVLCVYNLGLRRQQNETIVTQVY